MKQSLKWLLLSIGALPQLAVLSHDNVQVNDSQATVSFHHSKLKLNFTFLSS